jgi:NADH-quinone oxidoreductase subunit A
VGVRVSPSAPEQQQADTERERGPAASKAGTRQRNAASDAIDGGWSRSIMLEQYFPILLFIVIGTGIGLVLLTLGTLVAPDRPDAEKLSPYECGFEAFEDARMKFDVRYYLVAILFILFDLEIAFLFPWAVVLPEIGLFGFWSMMIFLGILIIGFIYEWKKGALEWE